MVSGYLILSNAIEAKYVFLRSFISLLSLTFISGGLLLSFPEENLISFRLIGPLRAEIATIDVLRKIVRPIEPFDQRVFLFDPLTGIHESSMARKKDSWSQSRHHPGFNSIWAAYVVWPLLSIHDWCLKVSPIF